MGAARAPAASTGSESVTVRVSASAEASTERSPEFGRRTSARNACAQKRPLAGHASHSPPQRSVRSAVKASPCPSPKGLIASSGSPVSAASSTRAVGRGRVIT